MNIIDTHYHILRFRIENDAPNNYMKRWQDFKYICENGNNKHIVEQIKEKCKLIQNKNLPYLNRAEGGMGGNDNIKNKQMRFRIDNYLSKMDNDIVIDEIYNTKYEKWTYDELDDIISAFIEVADDYVNTNGGINGCIEMTNEKY